MAPLFHTRSNLPSYYLALGLLGASLGLMSLMVASRWGLFFRAIRENEQAAAAAGVKVVRFRIMAFAIASGFAGLAGTFYGPFIGILTPDIGSVDQMGAGGRHGCDRRIGEPAGRGARRVLCRGAGTKGCGRMDSGGW